MSKLHIDVSEHGHTMTVSEMRRMLARSLSKLKGESKVTFAFHCQVEVHPPCGCAEGECRAGGCN